MFAEDEMPASVEEAPFRLGLEAHEHLYQPQSGLEMCAWIIAAPSDQSRTCHALGEKPVVCFRALRMQLRGELVLQQAARAHARYGELRLFEIGDALAVVEPSISHDHRVVRVALKIPAD